MKALDISKIIKLTIKNINSELSSGQKATNRMKATLKRVCSNAKTLITVEGELVTSVVNTSEAEAYIISTASDLISGICTGIMETSIKEDESASEWALRLGSSSPLIKKLDALRKTSSNQLNRFMSGSLSDTHKFTTVKSGHSQKGNWNGEYVVQFNEIPVKEEKEEKEEQDEPKVLKGSDQKNNHGLESFEALDHDALLQQLENLSLAGQVAILKAFFKYDQDDVTKCKVSANAIVKMAMSKDESKALTKALKEGKTNLNSTLKAAS